MPQQSTLTLKDALNGLGHAVLIFDSEGEFVQSNRAAATVVGADLKMIKEQGWRVAETLFKPYNVGSMAAQTLDDVRKQANESSKPVAFQILLSGEFKPCWASAVPSESGGEIFTMLTIDNADWTALTDIVNIFRKEVKETVAATRGHIDIINSSMKVVKPEDPVKNLTKRISGFNQLIDMQMFRTAELIQQMERLENIRTGDIREFARQSRKRVKLAFFLEDFLEEMEHADLLDPETEKHDYRARISYDADSKLSIFASQTILTRVLRDILRNAIMYSMMGTPIKIHGKLDGAFARIDITDEGYGIREKEYERVFTPFQRARQPQVIAEFGYGMSLYLCKYEVEAMNGRIWFESEEKVGTTFSMHLPLWQEPKSSSSGKESDKR